MIREDKKVIFFWYEHIDAMKKACLKPRVYCKLYNLDFKKCLKMIHRIDYLKYKDKDRYDEILPLGHEFINSSLTTKEFSAKTGLSPDQVKSVSLHIKYNQIITKMINKKNNDGNSHSMKFVQVQHQGNLQEPTKNAEVIEKQNDLEIIIAKGVKVSISPNIDTMKVIKIIELLKDL